MSTSDDIRIIKDASALLADMTDGAHVDDVRAELVAALDRLAARIAEDEQTIGQMSTVNADLVARIEQAEAALAKEKGGREQAEPRPLHGAALVQEDPAVTAHDDAAPIARGLLLHATADEDLIFEALAEVDRLVARIEQLERGYARSDSNEVCACLLETGKREVEIVERCVRCGLCMDSDAYTNLVARCEQAEANERHMRNLHDWRVKDLDEARMERAELARQATEDITAAEARVAQLEGALREIQANAENWHGNESVGTRAQRALNVIAGVARAALDAARPADTKEEA
jgi:hypothetical protein